MGEGLRVSIRHRTATAVVAAFLLGVGLTACDDGSAEPPDSGLPSESELSPSSPPTTEPTPSEPAGPTPPELPEAATRNNKAGAKAFVAYYLDLLNYVTHTGDGEALRNSSLKKCAGCLDDAEFYEKLYTRGGWARGLTRSVGRVVAMAPAQPEDVYVGVEIKRTAGKYKLGSDAKVKTLARERTRLDFYLAWTNGHWMMGRVERPA